MYTVTRKFSFNMAHLINAYIGLENNLHGHSYTCYVKLVGEPINGIVYPLDKFEFVVQSKIIDKLNNSFAFNSKTNDVFEIELKELCLENGKKVTVFPYETTNENIARFISDEINSELASLLLKCESVTVCEDDNNYATYKEE